MPADPIFARFGLFELDLRTGELSKSGRKLRLQEQPLRLLRLLLEQRGDAIPRESLKNALWPADTFVDFNHGLNTAIAKLRLVLGDSADNPRFIETLSRYGYRFIAPVEIVDRPIDDVPPLSPIAKLSRDPPLLPDQPTRQNQARFKFAFVLCWLFLILGLAGWWLSANSKQKILPNFPVPLTAAQGAEGSPTFSPDGSQIAYTWADPSSGGIPHIYIKTIGSGRPVAVTSGAKAELVASWSPDGRMIAFVRDEGEKNVLCTISPSGGTERRICEGHFDGKITWAADNRFLIVSDRSSWNGMGSLYLIATEDGKRTRLTTPPDVNSEDRDPAFSHDGSNLLFTRCRDRYARGLYLLKMSPEHLPSSDPVPLVDAKAVILESTWGADDKAAVYPSYIDKTYNPHLMRIRIQPGVDPEPLSYTGEQTTAPVIASRGNRMAYVQDLIDADIVRIQPGKPPQSFASSTRDERAPQYSPDGKRVVFQSNRSGSMNIWVCDSDGKNPVQLTNSSEFSGTPRWSPDGRSIAFDRHLSSGWHIFVMASDGGQVRQLTSDRGDEMIASWSRNGKWIYFASNRTGVFEVWKAPSAGGKGHQVTRHGGYVAFEAADGRSLYYTKIPENLSISNKLWELPTDGTEEHLLPIESIGGRVYTVANDGIYYMPVPTAGGRASVRRYTVSTKKDEEITSFSRIVRGVTVSPDQSSILLATNARTGSNVMVIENFK